MPWLEIWIAIVAFTAGYCFRRDECPRNIRGWDCKGDICNHSRDEVRRAKIEVAQNYWKGPRNGA